MNTDTPTVAIASSKLGKRVRADLPRRGDGTAERRVRRLGEGAPLSLLGSLPNHRRYLVQYLIPMANVTYDQQLTALQVIDPNNDFISEGIWGRPNAIAEANSCVPHMNIPSYASAIVSTNQIVEALSVV